MTDVIVLAAGLGRRLAGVTNLPKWLTPVSGSCPASVQLGAFSRAEVGRVFVVVSDTTGVIADYLEPWRPHVDLHLVSNPRAAELNNWYSLLLGLEAWDGCANEDVAVVNSDLFAAKSWFSMLLEALPHVGEPAALAVDRSRGTTDEAMKVSLDVAQRCVAGIGKVGIPHPGGEYVGMAWWSGPSARELRAALDGFAGQPSRADNWYEHGIQCHLEAGGRYGAVPVPSSKWVEIDDERDLEAARLLVAATEFST